jgi:hypothetical protein
MTNITRSEVDVAYLEMISRNFLGGGIGKL